MAESEGGDDSYSIPKNFALRSMHNGKYLRYVHQDNKLHGFLQYSGNQVVSPYTKFTFENAKTGEGKGLVHIRCSLNNKYWVRWKKASNFIVATADEPEEDQSKYSCTLFKPIYHPSNTFLLLLHVQLNALVRLYWLDESYNNCLFAGDPRYYGDKSEISVAVNWDSLFVLPKYVAFKGDNGKYLRANDYNGNIYLQFSGTDLGDPLVANEVLTTPDGYIRIKNIYSKKFWVLDPNWIHAKATESDFFDRNSQFEAIKHESGGVALRNLGNNWFCKRLSFEGKDDCLNAGIEFMSDETRFEIEEPVISREIYNVKFRLLDARVYGETPLVLTSGTVENDKASADKLSLKLSYEDTKTVTWSSSISMKLGVKITISTGVPKISEGEIEVSAEMSEEYSWGATQQTKNLMEVTHDIVVPARSKVKTSIVASQATCDIPFSYTQRDELLNGTVVIRRFHDGIYTGVNSYDYQFVTETL